MSDLLELAKLMLPFLQQGAYVGAAGTLLMFLIRLYRLAPVQSILPKQARWDSLPPLAKVALPFLLALAGSVLVSLSGGATLLASLSLALPAALAAVGLHHGTKSLGQAMTNSALKAEGPSYVPSKFRKFNSIVVPLGRIPQDVFDRTP